MNQEQAKQIETRMEEVKKEIAQKSAQDSAFRAQLVANPQATIEQEYNLPAGALNKLKIQVITEEPGTVVLAIPPAVAESGELTDEQLEAVAGGVAFIGAVGAIAGGVVGVAAAGATVVAAGAGAAAGVAAAGIARGW